MGKSSKSKAAAVEELDMDDDLELIEDEDDAPAPKASKKNKAKAAAEKPAKAEKASEANVYGAGWLAEYVNEELDTNYTAAQMRVIMRRMASAGDIEREVGTDRARYSFTGENDRTVKAVLKHVKAGAVEEAKKERITAAQSGKGSANVKRKAKDQDSEVEAPVKTKKSKKTAAEDDTEEAPAKPKATRKRNV